MSRPLSDRYQSSQLRAGTVGSGGEGEGGCRKMKGGGSREGGRRGGRGVGDEEMEVGGVGEQRGGKWNRI